MRQRLSYRHYTHAIWVLTHPISLPNPLYGQRIARLTSNKIANLCLIDFLNKGMHPLAISKQTE